MPAKTKSTKKKSPQKKASSSDVMTITLTKRQQAQLKEMSKGAIDAKTIKLRPEVDVTDFLSKLIRLRPVKGAGIAPPPKDTYWV